MIWRLSGFADEAGLSVEEQIQAVSDSGLRFIDLRGIGDHNVSQLPIDQAENFRKMLDNAGIRVNMLGTPIGKIDIKDDFQIDLDRLEHLKAMAEVFDCRDIRVFSYFNKSDKPREQWRQVALDRLGQLKGNAGKAGLSLWCENELGIFGDYCDNVKLIADQLRDGETFRMIFDFDNYNQAGEDVYANWGKLKDQTDGFHLKDSTKDCMHVPIGQGAGCATQILSDALKMGWQGPLSMEPHLAHSKAVMATGPHGRQNQALADLTPMQAFIFATQEAKKLLDQIGATYE